MPRDFHNNHRGLSFFFFLIVLQWFADAPRKTDMRILIPCMGGFYTSSGVPHICDCVPTASRLFPTVSRLFPTVSRLFPGCFSLQPRLTETFAIPTETLVFGVTFDYSICFRHPTLWFAPTAFAYCPKLSSQLGSHWFCLYTSNVADMVSFVCNVVSYVYRILVHLRSNMGSFISDWF